MDHFRPEDRALSNRRAQRIANEYEVIARKLRTAQHAQGVIQNLYLEATGTPLAAVTTWKFALEWKTGKIGSVDPKTHSAYTRVLNSFHLVSENDIRDWRDKEATRVSSRTANFGLKAPNWKSPSTFCQFLGRLFRYSRFGWINHEEHERAREHAPRCRPPPDPAAESSLLAEAFPRRSML